MPGSISLWPPSSTITSLHFGTVSARTRRAAKFTAGSKPYRRWGSRVIAGAGCHR